MSRNLMRVVLLAAGDQGVKTMSDASLLILHPEPAAPAMLAPMLRALGHEHIEAAPYSRARRSLPSRPGLILLGVDPIEPEMVRLLGNLRHGNQSLPFILLFTGPPPRSIGQRLSTEATAVLRFPLPATQLQAAVTQALEVSSRHPQGAAAPVAGKAVDGPVPRASLPEKPWGAIEARHGDALAHVHLHPGILADGTTTATVEPHAEIRPLKEALEGPERAILIQALRICNWSRNETADALEISRSTLYHKMKKYHLLSPSHE
jgi:DNA-binding NtrC family response regulator